MSEETIEATSVAIAETPAPTSIQELQRKMKLTGKVERLELYGAFVDVGVGTNALIHISQLSDGHVNRVKDVLTVGQEIPVWVDKIDTDKNQIMLTMIEPLRVEWRDLAEGQVYTGTVSRLETFGAFINIGAEREGLVHISELSHDYIKHPSEVIGVESEVQVQVLGFSKRKRRIDLSIKALLEAPESKEPEPRMVQEYIKEEMQEEMPTAMEIALRRAMSGGGNGDDGFKVKPLRKQKKKQRRSSRGDWRQQLDILERTLHIDGE